MRKTRLTDEPERALVTAFAIDSMQACILYRPLLAQVHPEIRDDGETIFVETAWGSDPEKPGTWSAWQSGKYRDAFWLRDDFLKVENPRQALHFLRDTGQFGYNRETPVSWASFRRWQVYTRLMMQLDSLVDEQETGISGAEQSDRQAAIALLSGDYQVNFFGLSHRGGISVELTKDLLGDSVLAESFLKPSSHTYTVEAIDAAADLSTLSFSALAAATLQIGLDKLRANSSVRPTKPLLLFQPHSVIGAIAAAIWIERQAGVRFGRCAECKALFRKGAQSKKKFCDGPCKLRVKKRTTRKNLADRNPKGS